MLLMLVGVLIHCFMVALIYRKIEFGRMLLLGGSSYLAFYVFLSGFLFWAGAYTIERATTVVLFPGLALCVGLFLRNRKRLPRIESKPGLYLPLLLILVIAGILCNSHRADFFGTGQDEGLYQIRAMYYMNNRYEDEIRFPEYENLNIRWEKYQYVQEIRDLEGLYLNVDKEEEKPTELVGVLHGLGTFPALLALWGRLFGMRNMSGILCVCYLLSIGNVWLLCRNLHFRRTFTLLSTALYAVSPVFLWSAQNTLTEIVLAAFITQWFVCLTDDDKNLHPFFSAVPILGVSMLHILISVLMPLIVILYVCQYLQTGKRSFLWGLLTILPGYGCGFSMMRHTAEVYTISNYAQLFGKTKGLLTEENLEGVVWTVALVCMALTIVFLVLGRKNALLGLAKRLRQSKSAGAVAKKVLTVLGILTLVFFIYKFWQRRDEPKYYPFFFIYGYLIMTGFFLLPLSIVTAAKRGMLWFRDRKFALLQISLYYIVWMYCGFLWVLIYYYFYYARYLTPFVFLPIVVAGYALHKKPAKVLVPVYAVLILLTVVQSRVLYTAKDMTYAEYEVIESVTSCIGEQDCVLINEQGYGSQRVFALPIKAISGADVYFMNAVQLKRQMRDYGARYRHVFLLSYDMGKEVADAEGNGWKAIYRGNIHGSVYDWYLGKEHPLLPYPKKATLLETPVVLMVMQEENER